MIKRVPNQKKILVKKLETNKKGILFTKLTQEAMIEAMQKLSGNTFKVYMYFVKNNNDYEFALSRVDVENKTGLKKTAYDNAIKQLIECSYLVQQKEKNNYIFYESPIK